MDLLFDLSSLNARRHLHIQVFQKLHSTGQALYEMKPVTSADASMQFSFGKSLRRLVTKHDSQAAEWPSHPANRLERAAFLNNGSALPGSAPHGAARFS